MLEELRSVGWHGESSSPAVLLSLFDVAEQRFLQEIICRTYMMRSQARPRRKS